MLWEFLLFPPGVVVLLRDTEMFSEAEESKEPAETEEEAGAEEGEEDNQAEMCEQGTVRPSLNHSNHEINLSFQDAHLPLMMAL